MTCHTHISVRDLNVYYGQQQALKNVSCDVPKNKITAIIGPSGCGKTTLLRAREIITSESELIYQHYKIHDTGCLYRESSCLSTTII